MKVECQNKIMHGYDGDCNLTPTGYANVDGYGRPYHLYRCSNHGVASMDVIDDVAKMAGL